MTQPNARRWQAKHRALVWGAKWNFHIIDNAPTGWIQECVPDSGQSVIKGTATVPRGRSRIWKPAVHEVLKTGQKRTFPDILDRAAAASFTCALR